VGCRLQISHPWRTFEFDGLDLTERRLYARIVAPQIRAYAPAMLAGYRSPFGGEVHIPGRNWTPEQGPPSRGP
jgi:hypothetical protein